MGWMKGYWVGACQGVVGVAWVYVGKCRESEDEDGTGSWVRSRETMTKVVLGCFRSRDELVVILWVWTGRKGGI
jgi:hypothetical protein